MGVGRVVAVGGGWVAVAVGAADGVAVGDGSGLEVEGKEVAVGAAAIELDGAADWLTDSAVWPGCPLQAAKPTIRVRRLKRQKGRQFISR